MQWPGIRCSMHGSGVSRVGLKGFSKSRKFKWLVKIGACKDVNPLIKKKSWPEGVSGQPENPPGYATAWEYGCGQSCSNQECVNFRGLLMRA